ncbi:MAG: Gfo/Idh/MocA family oxidoreductase [Oligosphaeraceae bacterium]|nr:Gfo/Idh/MocA family oxidoreductase [Oligosphaeraceae bacterium]
MSYTLAIAGLRHGHIFSLIAEAKRLGIEIVAAAEEDAATHKSLESNEHIKITHSSIEQMLKEAQFDILGVGDYYSKRGSIVLQALRAGKHVVADKPLCTSIDECDQIAALARKKKLAVSSMFGLRNSAVLQHMKELIAQGAIGAVRTLCVSGQHPLMLGSRPSWYFEEGKHGGTINDIGIHAADLVPWLTGLEIVEVSAARCWNAKASETPWFKDCAQIMLKLNNGGGMIADFSYLSPDKCGFKVRQYWRITVHGDKGLLEYQNGDDKLMFADSQSETPQYLKIEKPDCADSYLAQIIAEIEGKAKPEQLRSEYVFKTSRVALQMQQAADQNLYAMPIG